MTLCPLTVRKANTPIDTALAPTDKHQSSTSRNASEVSLNVHESSSSNPRQAGHTHASPRHTRAHGSHVAIVQVACGRTHTLAVTERGQCFSWGEGAQLGTGTGNTHHASPQRIAELDECWTMDVAAGHSHSLAIVCNRDLVYRTLTPLYVRDNLPRKLCVCNFLYSTLIPVYMRANVRRELCMCRVCKCAVIFCKTYICVISSTLTTHKQITITLSNLFLVLKMGLRAALTPIPQCLKNKSCLYLSEVLCFWYT